MVIILPDKLFRRGSGLKKKLQSCIFIAFILFFFFNSVDLISQNRPLYFNHLTREDGLLSNRINHLAEDSLGFIWFATEEGLNKFDGYGMESYKDFSFGKDVDNAVDFILEDKNRKPNLWLGTHRGLVYFDRYKMKFKKIPKHFPGENRGNVIITGLAYDTQDNIWIATMNGLFVLNNKNKKLETLIPQNLGDTSSILTIYKDNSGKMWIGSRAGIFSFNLSDSTFRQYYKNRLRMVKVIRQDKNKHFIIATANSGLYFLKGRPGSIFIKHLSKENGYFVNDRVTSVIESKPGVFFILIRDGELYVYNKETDKIRHFPYDIHNPKGINSTALISGLKSSQGIIWIGTYNSGVDYYDKAQKKFMLYNVNFKKDGLFNNNVRALAEDENGFIWIGTKEGGGLSRFDKEKGTFLNFKKSNKKFGLRDDYIFSVCPLNRRELLVGTFRAGMALFDKQNYRFVRYFTHNNNPFSVSNNRIYSIFKDYKGTVWIGSFKNVQIFNPAKGTFKTLPNIRRPRCFCEENDRYLWVGTKGSGLYLLDKQKESFTRFLYDINDTNSLNSNDIYGIAKAPSGNVWIATKQGLDCYDKKQKVFIHYTEKDGLPSNWVRAVLIDARGNVWASTSNGITKFDVSLKRFHNYDVDDNLQGKEFERYVALKTHDGYMLFGGHNGFNIFRPEEITDNKRIPPVYITEIDLFNKIIPVGKKKSPLQQNILFTKNIVFHYNQSALTIKYVALNYTSSQKNHYKYKLEGFDKDWINAGVKRAAVYTNIPPGDYTFKVIGSNNDNYWNKKGAQVHITILPPFWQTGWAYAIYVFLLIFLFLFFRKIMKTRIQQQNLLEFERLDKQRIQQMNQAKLHFFTNISHEFRTPLTLISAPLERLLEKETFDKEQRHLLQIISNNVKRLLFLVNELMDFRKAEQGKLKLHITENNIIENVKESISCFEGKANEKEISLVFRHEVNNPLVWFDYSIINKVTFNLLSNAVKFTGKKGKIIVELSENKQDEIILSIKNTGKGIPENELKNIFERFYQVEKNNAFESGTGIGLTFTKRLIETHLGSITVESIPNEWTTFRVIFPAKKEAYPGERIFTGPSKKLDDQITTEQVSGPALYDTDKSQYPFSKTKILIVEDNDELRNYLKTLFSGNVLSAANGKEGLEIATREIPDIIISDIMMPEMNGIDLCAKIKTQIATSHIPVILLTAKSDIEHKIKGIETGADAYIEKPFNVKYLQSVVKNLILQREKLRKKFSGEPQAILESTIINSGEQKFVRKIRKTIENNMSNPDFSVEQLGREMGLSRSQLFRKFKAVFDMRPNELIRSERLKFARMLLIQNEYNVNEVSDMAGFNSTSYFITAFKKYFGKTPNYYRNQNSRS